MGGVCEVEGVLGAMATDGSEYVFKEDVATRKRKGV